MSETWQQAKAAKSEIAREMAMRQCPLAGGSPAEAAGLRGGDVIVEFAGQKIPNIYDYTYALDAVKIGQSVAIVVERDGARVTLSATPEARK
jgi:S1-C subfamily serine protease